MQPAPAARRVVLSVVHAWTAKSAVPAGGAGHITVIGGAVVPVGIGAGMPPAPIGMIGMPPAPGTTTGAPPAPGAPPTIGGMSPEPPIPIGGGTKPPAPVITAGPPPVPATAPLPPIGSCPNDPLMP